MKLSMLLIPLFLIVAGGIGIGSMIYGDAFGKPAIFAALFLLGGFTILNSIMIEKYKVFSTEFMEKYLTGKKEDITVEPEPTATPEPIGQEIIGQQDKINLIVEFIISSLNSGSDLDTVVSSLIRSGYEKKFVKAIINKMLIDGIIKIEKPAPEPEGPVPAPPKVVKKLEKKKAGKKEEVYECKECGEPFNSKPKLRMHYGKHAFE